MDAIHGAIAFGVAFAASVSCMPVVRALGARAGMVDAPGTRKIHSKTAVRAGGLGVALGVLIAIGSILIAALDEGAEVRPLLAIGALALPVTLIGVIEDATTVKPKFRLFFQGLGAVSFVALMFGIIETYAEAMVIPPMLVAGVVGFVLLAGINAVNLIDGIDGLAASMVVISGFGIASIYGENTLSSLPALCLAGALLGFLPWNLRESAKRRLFLGDGG
ncbi:MAG: hypothetical protein KDB07_05625, partial [Planctomycetes bacterium]|nr:hypothetical protein [Planctomycetota bacterium]